MNFSSWAYKSFTRKLSRTKITVQLSHSCDVTTACLGLEATATWVRRNASSARPSGTNSLHQPDVRSTTISYNVNHLPWPKLKSYNTSSTNVSLEMQPSCHSEGSTCCTRPSAPAVRTRGPPPAQPQPEGPRSDTACLSLLLSEGHVACPQSYKRFISVNGARQSYVRCTAHARCGSEQERTASAVRDAARFGL